MITFLTVVYVIVCIFLILVVLLQAGKGGGMGTAFGGSSQSVFGGAGAGNFLTRLTVVMAAAFMLLSASLSYLSSGSDKALENAAKAIKVREAAQKLSPEDKKKAATKGEQSAAPASTPGSDVGAGAAEDLPVVPGPEEALPAARDTAAPTEPNGLKAVDEALAPPTKKAAPPVTVHRAARARPTAAAPGEPVAPPTTPAAPAPDPATP